MIDSLVVYLGLMIIMMIPAAMAEHSQRNKFLWAAISSLAFAIVMAIRWNVGMDFMQYHIVYQKAMAGYNGDDLTRFEPGFLFLYYLGAQQFIPDSIIFGIIAFFQIFLIFVGLRKFTSIWAFIPMTLMLSVIFISFDNIMRHMMAFSIFVCAVSYLADRHYWKYLLLVLLAVMFHKSAVILFILPLIYCWCKEIFSRIWVQLLWVAIGLIMMNIPFVQTLFETISLGFIFLGYDHYLSTNFAVADEEVKMGIGFAVLQLIYLIPIVYSNKMKSYFGSRTVNIMYDMFVIGYFLKLAFLRMFLIQRLNYYFFSFEFIIGAFTFTYLAKHKDWLIFGSYMLVYLLQFYLKISANGNGVVWYQTIFD